MNLQQEFEARMHFMRIFDTFCTQNSLRWTLYGDFLRRLLSGMSTKDTTMTFAMKGVNFRGIPLSTEQVILKMNEVIKLLEMIGMVRGKTHISDATMIFDVEVLNSDNNRVRFPIFIYCGTTLYQPFSCDSVSLTPAGLIVSKHADVDYFNNSFGVALLQRMFELKTKCVKPLKSYVNEPQNRNSRLENVSIMYKENTLLKEGFTIDGPHLHIEQNENDNENENINSSASNNDVCAICFEESRQTKLQCGHLICLDCLGKHMQRRGDSHSKCPLCRSPIMLNVVT